ncbi:MAG TPA: hypothetical protein VHO46_14010 [Bacteroidales bacterium]|nr:hypothetical protein [Bacteroidales bacterium]
MLTVKEEVADLALKKDDLLRLSQYHNKTCISIYIPTHRLGVETLKGQDSINLKNQLRKIRNKLSSQGLNSREIEKLVNPVLSLIDDTDFWRHQSEGLAVFVSEDVFEKYTVPVPFAEFNYLSSSFYLKQLFPLFNDYGHFFLLTLKKDDVKFFEGNKYGLTEINVEGLVPSRLEDSVGYDFEQKQIQFRTQLGGNKPGSFHGHGESEARDKNELLVFFREIDKGIMSKLHDQQEPPLILCCLDYFYPVYREACTHKNLFPKFISGNPTDFDTRSLHIKAWEALEPYFMQGFLSRKERYLIGIDKGKASSNIREIVPAAVSGKIDTLFLEKNTDIFGIYDPSTGGISIQEEQSTAGESLLNLAAKKVFEQGGAVYLLEKHHMPDGSSEVNALFRY